jgi:L-idonate 5-dehydrogenase
MPHQTHDPLSTRKRDTMRALRIQAAAQMDWEDAPVPEPGPDQVRLRVRYVGICGSDLHYYFNGANGENVIREPLIPGHELSAEVDLDPSGQLAPGTAVTVHPARYGQSQPGLEDHPHLWPQGQYLGSASSTPHCQGALADLLVVERSMVRVLPAGLGLRDAALAEPLAVALHALTVAGDVSGKRVLVLGAGPVGLLALTALRSRGAAHVAVGDIQETALERARALGADAALLVGTDEVPADAYDLVFECSAAPASLSQAVLSARPASTIVQVGILPDVPLGANLSRLVSKELQLRGTFRFDTEIDDAVEMLAAHPGLSEVIVTHVLPAAEAVAAFDVARDSAVSGKVLIEL